MKKTITLIFLSLTVALTTTDVNTKRISFEVGPNINQVDFSDILVGSEGIFSIKPLYMENFSTTATIHSSTYDGETEYWFDNNLGIKISGSYGSTYCGISYNQLIIGCDGGDGGEIKLFDPSNAVFELYEDDFEGCTGNSDCNWQITGTMYVDITGPFNNGSSSSDEIDDLQEQIDSLVAQLTGCVDCQGDASNNGMVNVQDIIILVEHILDVENGDCYLN